VTRRTRRRRRRARGPGQAALTVVGMKRRGGGGTRPEKRTKRRGKRAAQARAPAATRAVTRVPAPQTQVASVTQRRSQRRPRKTQRIPSRSQAVEVRERLMRKRKAGRLLRVNPPPLARKLPPRRLPRKGLHRPRNARPARKRVPSPVTAKEELGRSLGSGGGAGVEAGRGVQRLNPPRSTLDD